MSSTATSSTCEELQLTNDCSANSDVYLGYVGWSAGSFDSTYGKNSARLSLHKPKLTLAYSSHRDPNGKRFEYAGYLPCKVLPCTVKYTLRACHPGIRDKNDMLFSHLRFCTYFASHVNKYDEPSVCHSNDCMVKICSHSCGENSLIYNHRTAPLDARHPFLNPRRYHLELTSQRNL